MKKYKLITIVILASIVSGCTPMTPEEKVAYEKERQQRQVKIEQCKRKYMLCLIQYGAKNTSSYDMAQIQRNFQAKAVCDAIIKCKRR